MNNHDRLFYDSALQAFTQESKTNGLDVNVNVLEYVARHHSCRHNKRVFNKKQVYEDLKKIFNREETNIILQLINAHGKADSHTYAKWQSHLEALKIASTKCV